MTQQTETKHTPTQELIKELESLLRATWGWTPDCEFVYRAVNNHEALLEAAKKMLRDMEAYYEIPLNEKDGEGDPLSRYRKVISRAEDGLGRNDVRNG